MTGSTDTAAISFLLVPGAGGASWQWQRLEAELKARGHDAVAVALPSGDDAAGWAEYGDAIVSAGQGRGRLILVAQSLAGFSAPLACGRLPVAMLVLLNAMIPAPDETGMDWWGDTRAVVASAENLHALGIAPESATTTEIYFHDTPPDVLAEVFAHGEPHQSMTPMLQIWPLRAWPDVPTRVLAGRDDRLFPLEFQRRTAKRRLRLDIVELPGGHMLALSHPVELAEALIGFAAEVG